jgi:phosphoglycerol transferase
MNSLFLRSDRGRAIVQYTAAVFLSGVVLACVYDLGRADINQPFRYEGDSIFGFTLMKGLIENGWYLTNPAIGAPDGCHMHDFPMADSLHFLWLKLLAFATQSYVAAHNLYFLLGFLLITLTSLFVLRRFDVAYFPAVVASVLYAFLPYHFLRSTGHLFLSSYYLVPLVVMVLLWICLDRLPHWSHEGDDAGSEQTSRWRRMAGSILICAMHSCAGVYYAFFACYLLVVAGVSAALHRRRMGPVYTACVLIGVTTLGVFANIGSHILYNRIHGPNTAAACRNPIDAEVLGLKITDLLLPTCGHRVPYLASKRDGYSAMSVVSNENKLAALGVVGSFGFCALLGLLLVRQSHAEDAAVLHGLKMLNVFAVLLATMGGLGVVFNRLVSPEIRCYNRFCIFVAFFSLFAVAILLHRAGERFVRTRAQRFTFGGFLAALLALGLLDQTPTTAGWDYAGVQQSWKSDGDLVARIEAILPPEALIHQMPFHEFPECQGTHRMKDYDHFRAYLHSRRLRWSYGSIKGRPAANRAKEFARQPVADQVPELARMGYAGIWVDRFGYEDEGAEVEQTLRGLLQVEPLVSEDARIAFYDLTAYARHSPGGRSPDDGELRHPHAMAR